MRLICDLHIHSKYSRATSRDMDLPNLDKWARIKGIRVIATGDFTHPEWLRHIKDKLEPAEEGLFRLKPIYKQNNNHLGIKEDPRFLLSTEISSIYSKAARTRKIHSVIFLPSLSAVEKFNAQLGWIGNLKSDGRPILGLDVKELLKITLDASPDAMLVPAHAWTPHFSIFGSRSGFDSLEEAFEELSDNIYAIETGLSSNPPMNWRLSMLDRITLISNSDAHCVHPDTNIYTIHNKPKPIKSLNPSKALSINLSGNLKQAEAKISKLHKLPSPPILYKIITRTKEIITTPEHRFFVLIDENIVEKRASELNKNDLVACIRRISNKGRSKKLPHFIINHKIIIPPKAINHLRKLRIKNKKTQKETAKYIGVKEDYIWRFEKYIIKAPQKNFIDKYCEFIAINANEFKKEFGISRLISERFPKFTNEKFCQILGYILGDGDISHSNQRITHFCLTDKDPNLLSHYRGLIKEIFNIKRNLEEAKTRNSYRIRYPSYLAKYFQKIVSDIVVSSPKRQIPNFIFGLPKKEIAAFLRGLFDAEGSNADHSLQITSSSINLIKEIQALLLKFGINSSIYHDFEKTKKKWRYKISIYGQKQLIIFNKEIGFNAIPKKEKLSKYLSSIQQKPKNCFADPLPLKKEILNIKNTLKVSCYDIPRRLCYHLGHTNTLKRNNVKEFIKIFSKYPKVNSLLRKIEKFAESDIIWEPLKEIKKTKSNCDFVYDLTVPNYENYVANGFITHNSPRKLGREVNILDTELNYQSIIRTIKSGNPQKFLSTIEFFPEEGKYHYDGHRNCNILLSPSESRKNKGLCPKCRQPLTLGVMYRVEELADRAKDYRPENKPAYQSLIPLEEIIAEALGQSPGTKAVDKEYKELIQLFGSEFSLLLDVPLSQIQSKAEPKTAEAIKRVREGNLKIRPGYDGVFGKIKIFNEEERNNLSAQKSLF